MCTLEHSYGAVGLPDRVERGSVNVAVAWLLGPQLRGPSQGLYRLRVALLSSKNQA